MPKNPSNKSRRVPGTMAGAVAAIAGALLLSACGPSDTDPGPGGVTVGEARALDEAAEMLDEQRLSEDAAPAEAD